MPIYAFQCTSCGHSFDRLQKMADPDPTTCPACGAESIKRQVTAPAFRLAGSGWYETDFKSKGEAKKNLADKGDGPAKPASDAAPAKAESKSDSKPSAA